MFKLLTWQRQTAAILKNWKSLQFKIFKLYSSWGKKDWTSGRKCPSWVASVKHMWVGGECGTSWRNNIFEYFSCLKLQDLVKDFKSAAGFPRIVTVFTSELKQAACSDVQDSQGNTLLAGQTSEMVIQSSIPESRLLTNSSWQLISHHGTCCRGERKVVLGFVASLFLCPYHHMHLGPWNLLLENRKQSVNPPRLLRNKAREYNNTLSSRITLCLPKDPNWFV